MKYSNGQDIMWIYDLFIETKKHSFEKCISLVDKSYYTHRDINRLTEISHESVEEICKSRPM